MTCCIEILVRDKIIKRESSVACHVIDGKVTFSDIFESADHSDLANEAFAKIDNKYTKLIISNN